MFKETIQNIKAEILWINYELTRQSTTGIQELRLNAKKNGLESIMMLCQGYDDGKIHMSIEMEKIFQNISSAASATHQKKFIESQEHAGEQV